MTCIVAIKSKDNDGMDSIYWGADSCVTGYDTRTLSQPKIFQVGELVFGGSGTLRMLQVMEHHLKPKKHKKKLSDLEYIVKKIVPQVRKITKDHGQLDDSKTAGGGEMSSSYFLVGYRNEIYHMGFDFSVDSPVEGYDAIGSGQAHALGSLWTTQKIPAQTKIADALGAAAFFSAGVREPFHLYKQTGNKLKEI